MKPIQKFSWLARCILSAGLGLLPGVLLVRPMVAQTAAGAAPAGDAAKKADPAKKEEAKKEPAKKDAKK